MNKLKPLAITAVLLMLIAGCPTAPDIDPEPEPEPSPVQVDSLKVLVWEDWRERDDLPPEQSTMMGSAAFREKVQAKGGEFLVLDTGADTTKSDGWIQDSKEVERKSLPWLMVLHPTGAWIGPLPVSQDETLKLIDEVVAEKPRVHKRGCN